MNNKPITIYQSFEEYWEKNKIIYPVDVLELAFKKIAEKAWNSAMESAKEHQRAMCYCCYEPPKE